MPEVTFTTIPEADDVVIDGVSMNDINAFRSECLIDGIVSCDWNTLHNRLIDHDVSTFWWFLTEGECRSIAEMAIRNTFFHRILRHRKGLENCAGGEGDWEKADCCENVIIRLFLFDRASSRPTVHNIISKRYWKRDEPSQEEHCFVPDHSYHLPCYIAYIPPDPDIPDDLGHVMCGIQVSKDTTKLSSWIIFQYDDFDIKPGVWGKSGLMQIPLNSTVKMMLLNMEYVVTCTYTGFPIVASYEFEV